MNLSKKIKELGPWYQSINLDGIQTTDLARSNKAVWEDVRSILPDSLEGLRFLDLGANAGYYSLMTALEGSEVVGVEVKSLYYKQSLFLKEFYQEKYEKKLEAQFKLGSISNIDFSKLGKFDYVYALSILYFIGRHLGGKYSTEALKEQMRIISELSKITDRVIVRTRNKVELSSIKYYTSLFDKVGFKVIKHIKRKRPIVLYGR